MSSPVESTEMDGTSKYYEVLEIIGKGSFGKVGKCIHRKTKETVALKVMKKTEENFGEREHKMMKAIRELDPDTFSIVRFIEYFEHDECQFLALEMLDLSVQDFAKRYKVKSFSLNKVRPMAKQLLVALEGLQRLGIMHTDIKPENVMLVDHEKQLFKVKLIDFGLARHHDEVEIGEEIQPLACRAPEVTLGLRMWEAVDMWSLGCCLVSWYLGSFPFLACSEYDNLSKIVHFMGMPEDELLTKALYTDDFFVQEGSQWRLKTLQEYKDTTDDNPKMCKTPLTVARDLEDLIKNFKRRQSFPECDDRLAFLDLLKKMFELNPEKRITPSEALLHPFITMGHLPADECYTELSHDLMNVASTQISPLEQSLNLTVTLKDKKQDESPGEVPAAIGKENSTSCAIREEAISKNNKSANNRTENARSQDKSLDEIPNSSSGHLSDTSARDNENTPETITRSQGEISMLTPSNDEQEADAINEQQRNEEMTCASDTAVFQPSGPSDVDDTNPHQHIQVEPNTALEILTVIDVLDALKDDCSQELPLDCSDLLKDIDESCTQNVDSTGANTKKTKNAIRSFLSRLVPRSVRVLVQRLFKSKKTNPSKPIFRKPKWANFVCCFPKSGPSGS